jgi:hypothetical protein
VTADAPTGESPALPASAAGHEDPALQRHEAAAAADPSRAEPVPAEPLPAEPLPAEPLPAEPDRLDPADPATPATPAESAASELDPAYDEAAGPEPYVAPDDFNTGARTEPFRGPFEPPPGQPKLSDFVPTSSGSAHDSDAAGPEPSPPASSPAPGNGSAPTGATLDGAALSDALRGPASEEKLEKIKDLYLTVEAIGDDNVGKHFDELMTRQRELISEYFKETGIGGQGPHSSTQTDQPSNG